MVYELEDTSKVQSIFAGWEETLIYSCMQKVMGRIFVTDLHNPTAACAFVGCFAFYAGKPEKELVKAKPEGFVIMTPQNEEWARVIEDCYKDAKRVTRYAIKKNTEFDRERLQKYVDQLPTGYVLRKIDSDIYDKCLEDPATADFVSAFESKEKYLEIGRGMVIMKDDKIVSGASSYTRYKEGIEIEVDTIEPERRKHLATIVCSALILKCLDENLYPSWDAQNMNSVRLAESLGYEYAHDYVAYEVSGECRTH
ncbi:MAG: GNAT family N-acetyltransferase [Lachnospiraceae bacterium]